MRPHGRPVQQDDIVCALQSPLHLAQAGQRNNFGFVSPDAIRTEIGRPRASRRLSAAMVTLSRSWDIDRVSPREKKKPLAYLSEITFDPTCGFAVPRRCALPSAVALDRSAGETVQRWPSSVTTVTDLRL